MHTDGFVARCAVLRPVRRSHARLCRLMSRTVHRYAHIPKVCHMLHASRRDFAAYRWARPRVALLRDVLLGAPMHFRCTRAGALGAPLGAYMHGFAA